MNRDRQYPQERSQIELYEEIDYLNAEVERLTKAAQEPQGQAGMISACILLGVFMVCITAIVVAVLVVWG